MDIPEDFAAALLPYDNLNVADLLHFPTPAPLPNNVRISTAIENFPHSLFSKSSCGVKKPESAAFLSALPMPSLGEIAVLANALPDMIASGNVSLNYPLTLSEASARIWIPLWTIQYWGKVYKVQQSKEIWKAALTWLQSQRQAGSSLLAAIPWKYTIPPRLKLGNTSMEFASLCSTSWLTSSHVDMMGGVFNNTLKTLNVAAKVLPNDHIQKLVSAFRHKKDTYSTDKDCAFLRELHDSLKTGQLTRIGLIVAIHVGNGIQALPNEEIGRSSNHWVAVTIDAHFHLSYADPLGYDAPAELQELLCWWTGLEQTASAGLFSPMEYTPQTDAFLCSILAMNAVSRNLLPERVELLGAGTPCIQARFGVLKRLIELLQRLDPKFVAMQSISSNRGTQWSYRGFDEPKTQEVTEKKHSAPANTAGAKTGPFSKKPTPLTASKPDGRDESLDNTTVEDSGDGGSGDLSADELGEGTEFDQSDLVDVIPAKPKNLRGGAPTNELMNAFLQPCTHKLRLLVVIYRCVGCNITFANRNKKHTICHATGCYLLPSKLRDKAKAYSASRAPSAVIEKLQNEEATKLKVEEVVVKKRKVECGDGCGKVTTVSTLHDLAKTEGRKVQHSKANLAIVALFCVAGLSTHISGLQAWKTFCSVLDISFTPPTQAALEEDLIIAESKKILELQLEELRKQNNLTVSCDGGTSRGCEAFWTFHISTVLRKVYLMEIRKASAESHTSQWIKDNVLQVIKSIGVERIAAVVSDSTGNTRLHRDLLVDEIPTMLNLPDIVHHISNMIKDVVKLTYFTSIISTIRAVITLFHKSHLGGSELKKVRKVLNIGRGLESIGKTRFGTIIIAARSVQRNLPAICRVIDQKAFDLKDLGLEFEHPLTTRSFRFEKELEQLVSIGTPALKVLTCLEANEANPGDVYIFWHAILRATDEGMKKGALEIPKEVQTKVTGILNARHNQIFGDGSLSSSANLYLAGAYLNATYLTSDIFMVHEVVMFLAEVANQEINNGIDERLTWWRGRATAFKTALKSEMRKYACQQFPFDEPMRDFAPLDWWKSLEGSPYATVVPILAQKIFSIRVNSMPEEQTISTITWMTPALRSQLSIRQVVARAVVRQYYATESKLNSILLIQPRKKSTPRPTVKFFDVKEKMFPKTEVKEAECVDEECDKWLDEPQDMHGEAENLAVTGSHVELTSEHLASFLHDTPPPGQIIKGDRPVDGNMECTDKEDNDFSMDFD